MGAGRLGLCAAAVALLVSANAADAALTTAKCLAAKRKAWSAFRKCEAAEQLKALAVKPTDLAKCADKRQVALAKADAKAAKAGIACRHGANGDFTVTDYDTGLMWEQKIATLPVQNFPCALVNGPSCVTRTFRWQEVTEFLTELNGLTANDASPQLGYAGYTDWRLPTIAELKTILVTTIATCDGAGPCIDPMFGPTAGNIHWSSSTDKPSSGEAWTVDFGDGEVELVDKTFTLYARAVRNGL